MCGADLLVVVRLRTGFVSCLALQAKRLHTKDDLYQSLTGGAKCTDQLKTLDHFARQVGAWPLYLLYNHWEAAQSRHWHCPEDFNERQLGCALVPIWHIWHMMSRNRRDRGFNLAHSVDQSRLWRCAFDCCNWVSDVSVGWSYEPVSVSRISTEPIKSSVRDAHCRSNGHNRGRTRRHVRSAIRMLFRRCRRAHSDDVFVPFGQPLGARADRRRPTLITARNLKICASKTGARLEIRKNWHPRSRSGGHRRLTAKFRTCTRGWPRPASRRRSRGPSAAPRSCRRRASTLRSESDDFRCPRG